MKRIFCLIMCFVFVTGFVYADENITTYTLSLEQAITLAKENNPQLDVIEMRKTAAEISLKAAYISQAEVKKAPVMFGDTQTPLVKKGYYVEASKKNIDLLKIEQQQIESKIAYDVTEKYFNYILINKLVDIAENSVKLAKENLDIVNKYYELGMVAQLDVKNAEANVNKACFTKEGYIRNGELAKENLKISLNITGDCEFELTDGIETAEYTSDVDADVAAAMDTRYDVNALKVSNELSKLNFEIVSIYNLSNTANYNNAKSDMLLNDYNYDNSKRLIGLGVRNTYYNILSAKENLISAENDYEIKKLEYEVAKVKYEVGSITNTQLVQAQNVMSAAEVQLENAKLTYMLAVEKYKYEITIGL